MKDISTKALKFVESGARKALEPARFEAHYTRQGARAVYEAVAAGAQIKGLKGADLLAKVGVELALTELAPEGISIQ